MRTRGLPERPPTAPPRGSRPPTREQLRAIAPRGREFPDPEALMAVGVSREALVAAGLLPGQAE